ncbi:hypothetical protein CEP54_006999 [Fusarium duplospermum]|uniref:Transmembrane protein n=1 Tax=Fusarium duplospermum TaxID=1325734 RepID=A0A428Q413_9HYPO|nr:hypothetical protein CEP54_006999 [Fusarium duplospermum]
MCPSYLCAPSIQPLSPLPFPSPQRERPPQGPCAIASPNALTCHPDASRSTMAESDLLQWTTVLILTALLLAAIVLAQIVSVYTAYQVAPQEIVTFVDTADFSSQENESYDRDVSKVQRLDEKLRLTQLLREIQRTCDDLREDLNGMLLEEDATQMRTVARLLWASKRSRLEGRVRRLDMLRMRFLVVYMGVVAFNTNTVSPAEKPQPPSAPRDLEKSPVFKTPPRPALPKGLMEGIINRPPLRSLTTQALVGHQEHTSKPHRKGWAGVVEELQTSPRMQQRHASIERAMSRSYSKSP